jgi:hypothetical protein
MKKILQYILLFLFLSFSGIIIANKTNRDLVKSTAENLVGLDKTCSKPIEYSIGTIDPKFGISKDAFIENAARAEKIWEEETKKELFAYNPEAEFKINLIFDERQQATNEAIELENKLEKLDLTHDSTIEEYNSLKIKYSKRLAEYESKVAKYEKRLREYEKDVKYWNAHGGISEEEYQKLEKERKELKDIYEDLEKEREAINALASKANQAAKEENEIIDRYNANLETYKSKFGETREFEKGVFDGTGINIYEFREKADLEMTLIHEFGHALGIGHLSNPDSIMYYIMGEQNLENPALTEEDASALKSTCKIE